MLWGLLLAVIPLTDFHFRAPRGPLSDYSFELIREAPPELKAALALLLLMNVIPVLLGAFIAGIDLRRVGVLHLVVIANVAAVTASLIGSTSNSDLFYVFLVGYVLGLGLVVAGLRTGSARMLAGLMFGVAVGTSLVFVVVIADANYSYGRLMGRTGPNYWGMTALTTVFAGTASRRLWLRFGFVGSGLTMMILCQSRGALLACVVGLTVVYWLVFVRANSQQRQWLVGSMVVAVALAGLTVADVILDQILLLNDAARGLGSGGTGRFAAWAEALDLLADNPLLGVGYRKHESFMTTASSAHNAYLAVLADTGFIGFVAYMALMAGGLAMALRRALRTLSSLSLAVLGLISAYMVLGLVERSALNTGNALSLMVLYAVCWSFRREAGPAKPRSEACTSAKTGRASGAIAGH